MERENKAENRIAVVTDSAAALDPELVQRLSARGNFVLVPMPVTIRTPGTPDRQLQDLTATEVDEAIMLAHVMGRPSALPGPRRACLLMCMTSWRREVLRMWYRCICPVSSRARWRRHAPVPA